MFFGFHEVGHFGSRHSTTCTLRVRAHVPAADVALSADGTGWRPPTSTTGPFGDAQEMQLSAALFIWTANHASHSTRLLQVVLESSVGMPRGPLREGWERHGSVRLTAAMVAGPMASFFSTTRILISVGPLHMAFLSARE
jgi:hypothetical protein